MRKYSFYLPKLNKFLIIKAKDESVAVWKLLNLYRLRETDVDGYKIMGRWRNGSVPDS